MNAWLGAARRRWPAIALAVSLVLNGFLIGLIITDWLRPHHRGPGGGGRLIGFELRRLADRLPDDAVDRVRTDLQALSPRMEAHLERIRTLRQEVAVLAAAPAPDRAAIDERLATLRSEAASMQEDLQRATYDAVLKLPPEMRARLAEAPSRR